MTLSGEIASLHTPVLLTQVLEFLAPENGKRYMDGTLGLGGHAKAVLKAAPESRLCGLDQDREALELAKERLAPFKNAAICFHLRFGNFPEALEKLGWRGVDGAILDLGVSSLQLDKADRGFSFRTDGPLDMRMDQQSTHPPAINLVNRATFDELRELIATLGEDPQAGRVARGIIDARAKGSINTTAELARIVWEAYPPAWRRSARRHPATRVFQALRMAVNGELDELKKFLEQILNWLNPGGRLVIISFHSLEDRMVKRAFRAFGAEVKILTKKPVIADAAELTANPRASSAKLRALVKAENSHDGNS